MMISLQEEKRLFRKKMRAVLGEITDKMARSSVFLSKIIENKHFQDAKIVMSFSSLPDEVQLQEFNEYASRHKKLLLPRISGDNIEVVEYSGEWQREEKYGILEPKGKAFEKLEEIDLILVPGLAFDEHNNRMGRGKAYYDRFLPNTQALKFGVCFVEQYVKMLPVDKFDVRMDGIIKV